MMWDGWLDFLAMGGYALYVWCAYAVALALVLIEVLLLLLRWRSIVGYLGWRDG
jgi:heme exporter protein D